MKKEGRIATQAIIWAEWQQHTQAQQTTDLQNKIKHGNHIIQPKHSAHSSNKFMRVMRFDCSQRV